MGNDSLRFAPSIITAHVGTLRVTLLSAGSYPHNFSVPSLNKTSATVSGTPGEGSATLTIVLTKPGTVRFVCTYHASAGMVGSIIVKA